MTLLEFAVLQGFPTWHKFRAPYVKKQIGNAFPPTIVRVLYEYLARWLDVQDGVKGTRQPPGIPRDSEVTIIRDENPMLSRYEVELCGLSLLAKLETPDSKAFGVEDKALYLSDSDNDAISVKSDGTLVPDDEFPQSRASSPGFEILAGPPATFQLPYEPTLVGRKHRRNTGGQNGVD